MAIEIKGTVSELFETKSVGAKGFQKREFVVTTDEKFPQVLMIEATGDRIQALDDIRVGDQVNVSINVKGRKWDSPNGTTKYFVTLDAWKVARIGEPRKAEPDQQRLPEDQIPF